MVVNSLDLQNFRSYKKRDFKFSSGTTLIVGPNKSGKTNLLEAIYLLSTGKSFRAGLEGEMISYGKEMARIKGKVKHKEGRENLEIVLTIGQVAGEKAQKKQHLINGVKKRMMDFVGNLRCVLFGPENLEIIIGSPAIRRDYLDSVLEQIDRDYRRASLSYKKGLRQRNKLLEQIRDKGRPRSILFFWNKLLVENGEIITRKREEFINFIDQQPEYFDKLNINYDKSIISPQRLEKYADEEAAAGMTLVGPHRDDFEVQVESEELGTRSLHTFGSRGEQRTAVFSLKLAELEFVAQKTVGGSTSPADRPVLLLDDIFSELDQAHRSRVFEVIPRQQTIITTTELRLIKKSYQKKVKIINLSSEDKG